MLEYLRNKEVLAVVAHPDDEVLGPGATLHMLAGQYGCNVRVVILGEGITSRDAGRDVAKREKELLAHRADVAAAQAELGYRSIGLYDFPDNRFDSVDLLDIVKVIEKEKESHQATIIFTHHGGDLNIDHQRVFQAVMTACRPLEGEKVEMIFAFETPSSTEWQAFNHPLPFIPNVFFSINPDSLEAKVRAMACYGFESRSFPHPRSPEALKALARSRGTIVGSVAAEAFMLIRCVANPR